jgi:hypothetical protein
MKIFRHNAASVLFEKLRSLEEPTAHNAWRCLYVSPAPKPNRELYRHFIVSAVTELLEDTDGFIYLCDEGDIFILFEGAVRPVLEKLSGHFGGLTLKPGGQPEDPHFTIFDLSRHWQAFYRLSKARFLQTIPRIEDHLVTLPPPRRMVAMAEAAFQEG